MSETQHSIVQTVIGNKNIFTGTGDIIINNPTPLALVDAKDRAKQLILLGRVKNFWIEGVLEKSVHNAVLLELGKETKPEAVDHPWEMVLELPDQTAQMLPSETKIIDVFEKMNRAVLILGEPGSGKTITLLELARDLITRAEADPTQPIPVVFNLSSWKDTSQPLGDWLVFELSTKYQIPKKIGRAWLEDNRILPLLDSLDEVALENRDVCVKAINHFGEIFGLPGRVVCCRLQEYTDLSVRLKLNGAVCLQPLSLAQVNSYLDAGGNKLIALRATLQIDEALQKLAQSPLMLSIMSLAYQGLTTDELVKNLNDKAKDRRIHLFDSYIQCIFKRKGKANQPYTREQTVTCLSWFAQKLIQRDLSSGFTKKDINAGWLSNRQYFYLMLLTSAFYGVAVGAIHYSISINNWGMVMGFGTGVVSALTYYMADSANNYVVSFLGEFIPESVSEEREKNNMLALPFFGLILGITTSLILTLTNNLNTGVIIGTGVGSFSGVWLGFRKHQNRGIIQSFVLSIIFAIFASIIVGIFSIIFISINQILGDKIFSIHILVQGVLYSMLGGLSFGLTISICIIPI